MYCSFGDFINENSFSIVSFLVLTSSIPALVLIPRRFFLSFHFPLVILFNISGFWERNQSYFVCIFVKNRFLVPLGVPLCSVPVFCLLSHSLVVLRQSCSFDFYQLCRTLLPGVVITSTWRGVKLVFSDVKRANAGGREETAFCGVKSP